jgi:hypothetical protein
MACFGVTVSQELRNRQKISLSDFDIVLSDFYGGNIKIRQISSQSV